MENKNVLTELRDGVLVVTINRNERRNAIDPVTAAEMEEILNHAEKDPAVGAILLTGAGERSFCAGEDLAALGENGECLTETEHGFAGITERLCSKPIVCACNGTAVAGGLEIALACDVIVAAEHCRFGLTEVKVGLLATSGGLVRLPKLIPAKIAAEMCLTAKLIDAKRAYEVGLVNYVVPAAGLMDKAMELAALMAANAPISMRLTKQILHMAPHMSEEDGMRMCRYMAWKYVEGTEDAVEGPKAFLEKRKPQWKNR
ncbi:enoyl-CoA hydratase [Clostridiaceae bacterium]|nr:enoyl-CoA hydratase [Clostridiaceae bacterium]